MTRTYDDTGRLKTVADWLGHTATYSYDTESNLTATAYPDRVTSSKTFDNAHRLTGISDGLPGSTPFLSLSYTRAAPAGWRRTGPRATGYDTIKRLRLA